MGRRMSNWTRVTEFLLLGFSNTWELQILHTILFLVAYMASLIGNLLVIMVIVLDHHLHSPMYFFLMNLSILDLGTISVTIPKSIANSLLNIRSISYAGCVVQVLFFFFFLAADFSFLTIMAYDRYVAICKPLHYETIMNRRTCIQMTASAWICGFLYSALHTGNTFSASFCQANIINQFFCEIPQLLKLTCSDSCFRQLGIIAVGVCITFVCFVFLIVSYIQIFNTVLRIPSEQGRHKAFSTCLPHLIVVSLFISTGTFAYMKPISRSPSALDLMAAILYSVLPPIINPIIYSMRNKDLKCALKKMIQCR